MIKMTFGAVAAFLLLLAGCAGGPPVAVGDTEAALRAKVGTPSAVHTLADGTLRHEYWPGPFGQFACMAQLDSAGRVAAFEQVRRTEAFARIRPDMSTKSEVLAVLGRPSEVSRVRLHNYEVWSYRYKENGVWDSMMHVHFDEAGVVRLMQNGPDPMYEKRDFFGN